MRYPNVFVHGLYGWSEEDKLNDILPYWGIGDNNVIEYLRRQGYEVYAPSLGPFNSAWDRACILWAYLYGGTVDFGPVHSKRYGHERYGETYPGVLEPGTPVNLFGHSFGGATVKEVSNLWEQGSKEEREAGCTADVFCGGHGGLLHTVSTLSGVNNGTTAATLTARSGVSLATVFAVMMGNAINQRTELRNLYDFKLSQWGRSPYGAFIRYVKNDVDNIAMEMEVSTVQNKINPSQVMSRSTYYFAYRAYQTKGLMTQVPAGMSAYCSACGTLLGHYLPAGVRKYAEPIEWFRNDGYVNLVGCSAPLDKPSIEADETTVFKPGIWYNMPAVWADHMYWCGHSGDRQQLLKFYETTIQMYDKLA